MTSVKDGEKGKKAKYLPGPFFVHATINILLTVIVEPSGFQ